MNNQRGITIIEMVMVIVIVSILVATAIPSFVEGNGKSAAKLDDMAGALGSASAINFAVRRMGQGKGTSVVNCTDVEGTLENGNKVATDGVAGNPDYEIIAKNLAAGPATCQLKHKPSNLTADFVGHPVE